MSSSCEQVEYFVYAVSHQILCIAIIVFIIYVMCRFIKFNIINEDDGESKTWYISLTFAIASLSIFIFYSISNVSCIMNYSGDLSKSNYFRLEQTTKRALYALWYIQYYLLLFTYFLQLNTVFRGTCLQLSKFAVYAFGLIFGFEAVFIFLVCILWFLSVSVLHALITVLATITILFLTIAIAYLFITKLASIHKQTKLTSSENDKQFEEVITRRTILISFCVIITVIDLTLTWNRHNSQSTHVGQGIHLFISTLDKFVKFLSVMLSYNVFNSYYLSLCFCVHAKCGVIVDAFLETNYDQEKIIAMMEVEVAAKPPQAESVEYTNINSKSCHQTGPKVEKQMSVQSNSHSVISISSQAPEMVEVPALSPTSIDGTNPEHQAYAVTKHSN